MARPCAYCEGNRGKSGCVICAGSGYVPQAPEEQVADALADKIAKLEAELAKLREGIQQAIKVTQSPGIHPSRRPNLMLMYLVQALEETDD